MPSTAKGLPYPASTDPVYQGAAAIQALAAKLDAMVPFAMQLGTTNVAMGASDLQKQVAVTWAVGRFTQTPVVVCTNLGGTSNVYAVGSAPTATGVNIITICRDVNQTLGSAVTVLVHWQAAQMLTSAGPGLAADRLTASDGLAGVVVTCHTEGCPNAGYAIPLLVPDGSDPEVPAPDEYQCGVCGEPITDVTAVADISSVPIPQPRDDGGEL